MDSTVLAAIIGAIATIIVAVIAAKVKTKKPAQEHDDYSRVEDDVTGKGKKSEQGHDDYSVKVEGNVTGSVVGGSRNIVTMITQGVSKHEFNHAQSNDYVERGRERVRAYAERITRTGEWDWNPLGHAIEYYVDAIRYDPQCWGPRSLSSQWPN